MSLFKKKIVKKIEGIAWGHLVSEHGIDVDTLFDRMRCVEREGFINKIPVKFLRIFKPSEAEQKGVPVMGWETFDEHPGLVIFEGYVTKNKAHLERKRT